MWPRFGVLFCCTAYFFTFACALEAQDKIGPAGYRFQKQIWDLIGTAWYREMQANSQKMPVGIVRIAFTVSPDSKITNVRVLANTSNEIFANICLRAIQQVKIPPVPAELLSHGKYEEEITFKMFPN
jgi:outer membrane biosynthesis protein TonB